MATSSRLFPNSSIFTMSPFDKGVIVTSDIIDGSTVEVKDAKPTRENDVNNGIYGAKLYTGIEKRVHRELHFLLHRRRDKKEQLLDTKLLSSFDCMNYGGTGAVDQAVSTMKQLLSAANWNSQTILDVGSGLGGPSRHLASSTGCSVIAMELQTPIHDLAQDLTSKCKLENGGRVHHVLGNVMDLHHDEKENKLTVSHQIDLQKNDLDSLDGVVSWLSFLHIPDKTRLFQTLYSTLKPDGGFLYCEDLYMKEPMSLQERDTLENELYCTKLADKNDYLGALKNSGFVDVTWTDVTDAWAMETRQRLTNIMRHKKHFVRLHGSSMYKQMYQFYNVMNQLFEGGNLGGVRYTARKATRDSRIESRTQ